jgi:hypothetical protein
MHVYDDQNCLRIDKEGNVHVRLSGRYCTSTYVLVSIHPSDHFMVISSTFKMAFFH